MFVGFPSIDQLGGWPESRNSKSAFGGDGLRNAQNSTCCGIRDFETTHLTQNIFFGSGSWENNFFGVQHFSWIFEISEIWSPAGELWTDLRPAGKLPGRILIDFDGFSSAQAAKPIDFTWPGMKFY